MQNSNSAVSKKLQFVLEHVFFSFFPQPPLKVKFFAIGHGNINLTYEANCSEGEYILQRINEKVFPLPDKVADNSACISQHMERMTEAAGGKGNNTFPVIIRARDGRNYHQDENGGIWRLQKKIENGQVFEHVQNTMQAHEVGSCLGRFHSMAAGMDIDDLSAALPGLHDLPLYLQKYDKAAEISASKKAERISFCHKAVREMRQEAYFFHNAVRKGQIEKRVVHGDPKVANVIFDRNTGEALSLIDLDTVGPGFLLHDIGDCLRSCSLSGTEEDFDKPSRCEIEKVEGVLGGYRRYGELSDFEVSSIYMALLLLTFELGVRFFTDYLEGNCYFTVRHPEENLNRAVVQFKTVESIRNQEKEISRVVNRLFR